MRVIISFIGLPRSQARFLGVYRVLTERRVKDVPPPVSYSLPENPEWFCYDLEPQARWFWNSIPKEAQTRIIGAIWCSHCGQKTTIINFKGNIQQGDLSLRGECLRCGGVVVRLLEGS